MHARFLLFVGVALTSSALPAQTAAQKAALPPSTQLRPSAAAGILSAKAERRAANQATLTLATKVEAGRDLKLFDAAGKELPVTRAPDGAIRAEVDPTRPYVLAPPPPARRPLPREGLTLPARYLTFSPTGAPNLGGLFIRPAAVPLTWNEQAKAYATELFVGYEFDDGRDAKLAAPKTVTFFTEGTNARIQADTVTIDRSSAAGYQRVILTTGKTDGETLFVARASAMDELKSSVSVQREPGTLKLNLPSTELPAFGIGSGELTVALLARDGMPLVSTSPMQVALTSRLLRVPATLEIPAGRSQATADVRTVGSGSDEVVAQSGTLRAVLPVKLVFPVAPIVAAVVGGVLGGSARYLRNRGRRGSLLTRRALEGVLVGVIVVGAAWAGLVGLDLSAGILGTPFGAFVLAALSGYLGCVVLDRVAKKTFGGGKDE